MASGAGKPNRLQIRSRLTKTTAGNVVLTNEGWVTIKKASGAATQVTLPKQAENGDLIIVDDGKGDAAANPITVIPDGAFATAIDGLASFVINVNYGRVIFGFNGASWSAMPLAAGNAGAASGVQTVRATTQLDKTSTTARSDVAGLSVNLVAGRKYVFRAKLYTVSTANGGLNVALAGTATATSLIAEGRIYNGGTLGTVAQVTALGTVVNATEASTTVELTGEIVVNAGGTLTVAMGQNASHADTSSVKVGSFLEVRDVA